MAELVRPWRGVSAEDRAADRRARLLEACLSVVGAVGVNATTIDRVCAEAGLTKRYFYEGFPHLDALLLEAVDDLMSALRGRMDEAIAHIRGPQHRTHAIVTILIDVLSEDPRRARLYVESPGHESLRRRRQQAIVAFTEFVATELEPEAQSSISHAQRLLATRLLVAGTTDIVTSWLNGEITADREVLIETIEGLGEGIRSLGKQEHRQR